jgi:hypothetical protein
MICRAIRFVCCSVSRNEKDHDLEIYPIISQKISKHEPLELYQEDISRGPIGDQYSYRELMPIRPRSSVL